MMYGKKKHRMRSYGNPKSKKAKSGGGLEGNPYGAGPIYSPKPMFKYS